MVNKRSNVVMIAEEDIEQLLTEWSKVPAWVKAHLTVRCPAHRYEGKLTVDGESLVFGGRDMKEGEYSQLVISLDDVTDVTVGFGEELEATIDPAFGIGGTMPFAVHYRDNGRSQTVYFNTCADNYPPHQRIDNIRWYEELDQIIDEYRRAELTGSRNRSLVMAH